MDEEEFLSALKSAIAKCELEKYIKCPGEDPAVVTSHYDIDLDVTAIRQDLDAIGTLRLSNGQQRMLMVIAALWDGRQADELFDARLSELVPILFAMDKENRGLLCELLYSYPGWAG